jgi:hypothetical protein
VLLLRDEQPFARLDQRARDLLTGIIGWRRKWTVSMISALSMPCRYTEVMPRLLWPIWALDDDQRYAFARELNGVRVAELVRREPSPDSGVRGGSAQLRSRSGTRPLAAARATAEYAEQRADG